MTFVKGILYFLFWYSSIFAGYVLLFCPLLPVLFISNKLYRYIADILFTYWQYFPTALSKFIFGCDVQVSGDAIRTGEMSLLVMNHRTRTDWNFFWSTAYHCVEGKGKLAHSTKFILKDQIRHIPGPGWVMQLSCFLYIKRCWQLDKLILKQYANYVSSINYKHSLLIFPEGTDLTEQTKKSSDKYAKNNNLPLYDHVLHPRTTGFVYLAKQLMSNDSLDAVYDITLAYPDVIPKTELYLFKGNFPRQVYVHLERYPKSVIPTTEDGLKEFLETRWLVKEKVLKKFTETGIFLQGRTLKCDKTWELYVAFLFWATLPFISLYIFITVAWFRNIVIIHTVFLLSLNLFSEGFQNFEINLKEFKQKVIVKFQNLIYNIGF